MKKDKEILIYSFREPNEDMMSLIESNQIEIALLDIELEHEDGWAIARK